MKALISPPLWGWIGQQLYSCYRAFESRHPLRAHSKMSDGLAFSNDRSVNGSVNKGMRSQKMERLSLRPACPDRLLSRLLKI
jgi:hypothetical protein